MPEKLPIKLKQGPPGSLALADSLQQLGGLSQVSGTTGKNYYQLFEDSS